MTEVVAGVYTPNEMTINANGGTEQMARRMSNGLPLELLQQFQIIHSRVRNLRPDLKKILVCHDLPQDPEVKNLSDPNFRKQFDKIVFVSNWQAQMYHLMHGVPYEDFVVIENGIERIAPMEKDLSGPIRLIYHTTPHRGLEILVPVFVALVDAGYDIELDVFSSFNAYGWGHRDKPYEQLFDTIRNHPKMRYHGFQHNNVIRNALKQAHIFAYPNIWLETSCIAAIEAGCSGCVIVHPNYGALPETTMHHSVMYQFHPDLTTHAYRFYSQLAGVINTIKEQPVSYKSVVLATSDLYNNVYQWDVIRNKWINLLEELSNGKGSRTHH